MPPIPFLDDARRLRSGWWIGIFFAVLTGLLLPLILLARGRGAEVSPVQQLVVVLAASGIARHCVGSRCSGSWARSTAAGRGSSSWAAWEARS